MKAVRKILVKLLGLKGYLRLISGIYIRLISMGMMRSKYAELYFISRILKPGNTCLDIGANLAYYSFFMAKAIGNEGQLLAVEPIPLFAGIWEKNMKKHSKLSKTLFNCALGQEAKDEVTMSIPIVDGVVRHGLTKVVNDNGGKDKNLSFVVPMRKGDELIESRGIEELHFIKCDVEGFEQFVIPSLDQTIDKFKPILQIELSGEENRQRVVDYLLDKSYNLFILQDQLLKPIEKNEIFNFDQDFYFIHNNELENRSNLIRK